MNKKIKVLVVDDSIFMRNIILDLLETDMEIEVTGIAQNGRDAVISANELKPDVITMDIEMPFMDGISSLREILKKKFIPVIMVSSQTTKDADKTIEALEIGAVDFIAKPGNIFENKGETIRNELISKIKAAYHSNGVIKDMHTTHKRNYDRKTLKKSDTEISKIIAIGSSTGGPGALYSLIPDFTVNLPAAIVITQHMPPGFTKSLGQRLDKISKLKVMEAEDFDILRAGHVYIAPGSSHMTFSRMSDNRVQIRLLKEDANASYRPSIDIMMKSLAKATDKEIIGVILTGMGRDGSWGIKLLKEKGNSYIIAQNEETSVIFGMPGAAIETGLVDAVLPLDRMSEEIYRVLGV